MSVITGDAAVSLFCCAVGREGGVVQGKQSRSSIRDADAVAGGWRDDGGENKLALVCRGCMLLQ